MWAKNGKSFEEKGLTQQNAFGCAMKFLFTPSDKTLEISPELFRKVLDPNAFVIGIHIRVEDEIFMEPKYDNQLKVDDFQIYWDTAASMEKEAREEQQVIWLFSSSSSTLRKKAKDM